MRELRRLRLWYVGVALVSMVVVLHDILIGSWRYYDSHSLCQLFTTFVFGRSLAKVVITSIMIRDMKKPRITVIRLANTIDSGAIADRSWRRRQRIPKYHN